MNEVPNLHIFLTQSIVPVYLGCAKSSALPANKDLTFKLLLDSEVLKNTESLCCSRLLTT